MTHGTTNGYRQGCRCQPCRTAKSAYNRDYWDRERGAASAPPSQMKPLTRAYRNQDAEGVIRELLSRTVRQDQCRVWQGRVDTKGYPRVNVGGVPMACHRLVAEAAYGDLHGEPVHHRCANPMCISPDHLQPVSARENVAEMLQRNWYEARIAELEGALAQLSPFHPLIAASVA